MISNIMYYVIFFLLRTFLPCPIVFFCFCVLFFLNKKSAVNYMYEVTGKWPRRRVQFLTLSYDFLSFSHSQVDNLVNDGSQVSWDKNLVGIPPFVSGSEFASTLGDCLLNAICCSKLQCDYTHYNAKQPSAIPYNAMFTTYNSKYEGFILYAV